MAATQSPTGPTPVLDLLQPVGRYPDASGRHCKKGQGRNGNIYRKNSKIMQLEIPQSAKEKSSVTAGIYQETNRF